MRVCFMGFFFGHVEITEDRPHGISHRYPVRFNVNIATVVVKWNFSSKC